MLKVKLLSHTPNPEGVVASAAKLCYSSVGVEDIIEKQTEESIEGFIKRLANIKHLSPFEHVNFTFAIEGVSRTLTHQLVRHRLASYSQQSQRYVKENMFEYIVPPTIQANKRAKKIFVNQMVQSQLAYDDLVNELMTDKIFNSDKYFEWYDKISEYESVNKEWDVREIYKNILGRNDNGDIEKYLSIFKDNFPKEYNMLEKEAIEDARYVFPNAIETKIMLTMNARTLMNFFSLRCCNRAQWEIRQLADQMLTQVYNVAPAIFVNSGAPCTFGKCTEGNMSCGEIRSFYDIVAK